MESAFSGMSMDQKKNTMVPEFKLSQKVEKKPMAALAVYNVGQQKCAPSYSWGPGVRDHYLLHYISSGKGVYRTEEQTFHLQRGDLFLALPEKVISYAADQKDPWTYEWVGFQGSDAGMILSRTDFAENHLILRNISYGNDVKDCLDWISAGFGSTYASTARMTAGMYLLFAILAEHARPRSGNVPGKHTERVRQAIEFISLKYSYGISIDEVAEYTGVSRSTLFREFREEMGVSPKEYLDRFRIERAARLLDMTDLKVGAVAASVGYENGLYFSKAFKKYTGKSPTQYRN